MTDDDDMHHDDMTDDMLQVFVELHPDIYDLDLGFSQITDEGLPYLVNLHNLHVLNLRYTKVTDAGLVHLAGLHNIFQLDLYGTCTSVYAVQALRDRRPDVRIFHG